MAHHITTFNPSGQSIFSSQNPQQQNALQNPLGSITYLYTTYSMPVRLTNDIDIEKYTQDRINGLPPGSPCPPNGTSAAIIELAPGVSTPDRRTITLGVFGVIEGVVRLTLDSGEERVLKTGDCVVLRAALHSWKNETPNGGTTKLMVFAQSIEGLEGVEAVWK